jgi:hypothetical protein
MQEALKAPGFGFFRPTGSRHPWPLRAGSPPPPHALGPPTPASDWPLLVATDRVRVHVWSWWGETSAAFDLICNAQRRVSTRPPHAPARGLGVITLAGVNGRQAVNGRHAISCASTSVTPGREGQYLYISSCPKLTRRQCPRHAAETDALDMLQRQMPSRAAKTQTEPPPAHNQPACPSRSSKQSSWHAVDTSPLRHKNSLH